MERVVNKEELQILEVAIGATNKILLRTMIKHSSDWGSRVTTSLITIYIIHMPVIRYSTLK